MARMTSVHPAFFNACTPWVCWLQLAQFQLTRQRNNIRHAIATKQARSLHERGHEQACSRTMPLLRTSIWWMIIGLLANSTKGFGHVNVKGRRRVPKPPTRIRAFMAAQPRLYRAPLCTAPVSAHALHTRPHNQAGNENVTVCSATLCHLQAGQEWCSIWVLPRSTLLATHVEACQPVATNHLYKARSWKRWMQPSPLTSLQCRVNAVCTTERPPGCAAAEADGIILHSVPLHPQHARHLMSCPLVETYVGDRQEQRGSPFGKSQRAHTHVCCWHRAVYLQGEHTSDRLTTKQAKSCYNILL